MSEISLSVIIPAYKLDFLGEALESLVAQTCQNFTVYIGDDASPHDIVSIAEAYKERLNIVYHRFDENLGGTSLTKQWDRCVRLSTEPWVWLFSDDDVADPTCVERFYKTLEETSGSYDLYRFDTICINQTAEILRYAPPAPQVESSGDFLYHRLMGERCCFAVEYIFSRAVYEKQGGFVEFPLAWNSDVATWALFGKEKGTYTMSGARVSWRMSGQNLSGVHKQFALIKIRACLSFIQWALVAFDGEESKFSLIQEVIEPWIYRQVSSSGLSVGSLQSITASSEIAKGLGCSKARAFRKVYTTLVVRSFLNAKKRTVLLLAKSER